MPTYGSMLDPAAVPLQNPFLLPSQMNNNHQCDYLIRGYNLLPSKLSASASLSSGNVVEKSKIIPMFPSL